jgi:hypothetical protein
MAGNYRSVQHGSSVVSPVLSRAVGHQEGALKGAGVPASAVMRTTPTESGTVSACKQQVQAAGAEAAPAAAAKQPPLLDQVRAKLRMLHYSIRTEEAYV